MKTIQILVLLLILTNYSTAQEYGVELIDSSFSVIESNNNNTTTLAQLSVDKANRSGEILLAGNFAKLSLNNLQIADLGGNELGLDGDIVPYSSTTFDLGNNVFDEHWDQVVANTFVTYSSPLQRTLKSEKLENSLYKIIQLNPVKYSNNKRQQSTGFNIDELNKIIPEVLVTKDNDYNSSTGEWETTTTQTGINYDAFIPLLVDAISEQQKEIELLKNQVSKLMNN